MAVPVLRSAGCAATTGKLHRWAGAERARELAASPVDWARRGQMCWATPGAVTGQCLNEMFYHVDSSKTLRLIDPDLFD